MAGKRSLPLRNAFEVRKALSNTWNCLKRREIDTDEARALAYVARALLAALEQGEMEARLAELETTQARLLNERKD